MGSQEPGQLCLKLLQSCLSGHINKTPLLPLQCGRGFLKFLPEMWMLLGHPPGVLQLCDCSGHRPFPFTGLPTLEPHCPAPQCSRRPVHRLIWKPSLRPAAASSNLTVPLLVKNTPTLTAPASGSITQLLKYKHELYSCQRIFPPC